MSLTKSKPPMTTGELNYMIQLLIMGYMGSKDKLSYEVLNDIIGSIESAKLEFYRRVVSSYEDQAINRNGDIYGETFDEEINKSGKPVPS